MAVRVLFLVNPAAGANRGLARWRGFERRVRALGIEPQAVLTGHPGEARRVAAEAAGAYDVLAAVGGDGTVLEVAEGILSHGATRAALAVLPVGTGNDLARNLGLMGAGPVNLASGQARAIDVLEVRCMTATGPVTRHALVLAGVGILGECLRQASATVKRMCGSRLAYMVGVIRALRGWQSPRMRVTVEGEVVEKRFLLASASNGEYAGGGLRLAPGARMNDGLFNATLVEGVGRYEALTQLLAVARGRHIEHPRVRYFTTTGLEVDSDPPSLVAADGEILGCSPARIRVLPRALRVVQSPLLRRIDSSQQG